jgi:hypothetical protein
MASFTAGTTFVDGVANDVTAAKLGALVNNATPTSGLIQDRTAETVVATNDTFLIGDASDSNTLKRMTVANVMKAEHTGTINTTAGTIEELTCSSARITSGTVASFNSTTATIPTLTSITKITSGTGTAAAPAISPTGDTNTGIFFPDADTIAFAEGGAESMRIDASGNVGIGTTSPATKLEVNGSTRIGSGNDYQWDSTLKVNGESTGASGYIRFFTNATERLRIDSSGNVGVGTTSPATKLTVSGSSGTGSELRVVSTTMNTSGKVTLYENTSGGWEFGTSGGANTALTIKDIYNNAERLRIDSSGNVIISSNKSLISNGASGIVSNTSIGSSALSSNTTGSVNTAIGNNALRLNTTGSYNTALGYEAIDANTTGAFNTAVGYNALTANTTGQFNVAVGASSLDSNTTGEFNVAVGPSSLGANTTGVRNVAVGHGVLAGNTTGSYNTAIGHAALDVTTTGFQNTASGYAALGANTTGNLNTAIGFNSGNANTTGTNNAFIGNSASNTSGGATASNTIVLGNSAITTLRCQTATISALSDARDKSNIEDIPVGIEFIKDLRPVKFTWNQRDGMRVGLTDAGFIAQESLDVVNKYNANWIGLVEDENKDQLAMTPGKLIPILVKAIQQISAKVDSLESQLANK